MRKRILFIVILFCLFQISCDKSKPIHSAKHTFYGDEQTKKAPPNFNDLPVIIQDSANSYLKNWLGAERVKDFHYYGGRIIDRELMSEGMRADTTVPDYVLHFSYVNEYADYTASLLLNSKGKVINNFDFPNISKYPEKEKIISEEEAINELRKVKNLKGKRFVANLLYDTEIGSFVWMLDLTTKESNINHKNEIIIVDAHSGKILEQREGLYYSY